MKKTLFIASLIALAMGAQAQVDEWINPFEKWGKYDYVQNESNQEFGKWFLEGGKYPTLAEYEDSTRIKFKSDDKIKFSIVFDLNDFNFPPKTNLRALNIKFHLFYVTKSGTQGKFSLSVKEYEENENPFDESFDFKNIKSHYEDFHFSYDNYYFKELFGKNRIFNEKIYPLKENYRYVRITIGGKQYGGDIYLSHIKITGTNGQLNANLREYNNFKYFYEPFFFSDLEGYQKPELTTSINNTMESNIYVSNDVLHTDEPSSVSIFNASGILVKTEHNTDEVNLSDLKKGVYIAKVNEKTIKFVR